MPDPSGWSHRLERALRWSAVYHRDQSRKGSTLPYVQHPMAVAMLLQRDGWPEAVVIAGLLHDLVEDTEATLDQIRAAFGVEIADWVGACSERKRDEHGRALPWDVRKAEHLERLVGAPVEARAVALADKVHNLASIAFDAEEGAHDWSKFNAGPDRQLAYYRAMFDRLAVGDRRLEVLAARGHALLGRVAGLAPPTAGH